VEDQRALHRKTTHAASFAGAQACYRWEPSDANNTMRQVHSAGDWPTADLRGNRDITALDLNISQLVTVPIFVDLERGQRNVTIGVNSRLCPGVARIHKLKGQQGHDDRRIRNGRKRIATAGGGPNNDGAKIPIHSIH
jgi:hypothetical protein